MCTDHVLFICSLSVDSWVVPTLWLSWMMLLGMWFFLRPWFQCQLGHYLKCNVGSGMAGPYPCTILANFLCVWNYIKISYPKRLEYLLKGFLGGSLVKNPPASGGDIGLIPDPERSPGKRNDNPPHCSCLETPWTEEPDGLQSIGSQKNRTRLSD